MKTEITPQPVAVAYFTVQDPPLSKEEVSRRSIHRPSLSFRPAATATATATATASPSALNAKSGQYDFGGLEDKLLSPPKEEEKPKPAKKENKSKKKEPEPVPEPAPAPAPAPAPEPVAESPKFSKGKKAKTTTTSYDLDAGASDVKKEKKQVTLKSAEPTNASLKPKKEKVEKPKPAPAPKPKKEKPEKVKAVSAGPDPNAVTAGVALGGAPLIAAPLVALAAGRNVLVNTKARRDVIAKDIEAFETFEAKRLAKKSADVDGATLGKAVTAIKLLPKGDTQLGRFVVWLARFGAEDPTIQIDMDRCPEEYVVSLYSGFAKKFDHLLVNNLNYETPTKLRRAVDEIRKADSPWGTICADLGCGTGLSGLAFKDCTKKLIGVDLSPEMIAKARDRKCYHHLVVGDLEAILKDVNTQEIIQARSFYDLIVACDVFVYIGDLRGIFQSVHKKLSCDGLFAFSTESLSEEDESAIGKPFVLHRNARLAHKRTYIKCLAREIGFKVLVMKLDSIRKNKGKNVMGFLVVLGE